MPHLSTPGPVSPALVAAIPEVCLPGEGMSLWIVLRLLM
jgi:hypothetical protein